MKRKIKVFIMIIFVYISINVGGCNTVYAEESKSILYISSYNPNFISFTDQIEGLTCVLGEEYTIQIEYLDWKNYYTIENDETFYNLFKYKMDMYNSYDALVLGDDTAFEFGMKYKEELFSNIPIVFLGVEYKENIERAKEYNDVYGVCEKYSIDEQVRLITKFHPGIKHIVYMCSFETEESKETFSKEKAKYKDIDFEIVESYKYTFDEFLEILQKLNENDAILMEYPYLYSDGTNYWLKEFQSKTDLYIDSPVYPAVSYGVESQYVGGKVISHYKQGKEAAKIVKSIISGNEQENRIVEAEDTNIYMFNYEKLKEYNIDEKELPKNSIIKNKPQSIFNQYKKVIITMITSIIILIFIIIFFIIYMIKKIRFEKEILKAKNIAEEANKAKNSFISNINHELRTPVAIILSSIQLLGMKINQEDNVDKEYYNSRFEIVKQNCFRLLRLINNIIDITKADSGFNEVNLKNVNIIGLLEEIVEMVIPYTESKNIELIFDTNEEVRITAVDPDKIERIILNLLSNAIKFSTEGGKIVVDIISNNENIIINIADNGIGIKEEFLEKIFEKFVQVDRSFKRINEGSGIGLSLVKSFVEMHSGKVMAISKENKGSLFIVELPVIIIEENKKNNQELIDECRTVSTKLEFSDIYF